MPKLTDEELIAAIEAEESVALDSHSGELRNERSEAWKRYRGELLGNEVEGRSQIVDKGVLDTIQWIIPSLARIYLGGDDIGQFEPVGPEDEYAAECETEVCNWYLQSKNDFYSHIVATLTDALLLKNGYIAGMWTVRRDVMTETYQGLADEEMAMLAQDADVEIVEHSGYPDPTYVPPPPEQLQQMAMQAQQQGQPFQMPQPPMLHDVKVERKKADEFVGIESIPPDEILVSRRHRWTSLADCDFVQWRRRVSIGQLRAEGFKVPDDVTEYTDFGTERVERERFDQDRIFSDETPDPSRKIVLFKDTYIRIDLRNSGTPQLWRIAYCDGQKDLSEGGLKEEADCIPFAAFSPIVYPHSHVGTSVYDLIADVCLIKTMMQRQLVDGTFLQTAGRVAVDIDSSVNVDDLLVSRPGGIIRGSGNPAEWMMPVVTPDVGATVMGALEYMDAIKEGRTGVTRYSAGLDGNTLNKTATGMQAIQSAANQRIELIARTLAGGFRDLFLVIHTLASKHSTKPVQMKLKGRWQAIDPRSWAKRTDFKINVGLGTGTPEQQAQKLMMMAQPMQQFGGMGLAGPEEAYNYGAELWKALGYKSADKFIHPPQKDPKTGKAVMPPPPKDPIVQVAEIKAQSDAQAKQMDHQVSAQQFQAEQQGKQQQTAMEMQAKEREQANAQQIQASNDARDNQKMQLEHERERERMLMQSQLDERKMLLDAELRREEIASKERATIRAAELSAHSAVYTADSTVKASTPPERKGPRGYAIRRGPDGRAAQLDIIN